LECLKSGVQRSAFSVRTGFGFGHASFSFFSAIPPPPPSFRGRNDRFIFLRHSDDRLSHVIPTTKEEACPADRRESPAYNRPNSLLPKGQTDAGKIPRRSPKAFGFASLGMTIWGLREQQASSNQKGSPRALASLRFIKTSNFQTSNLKTLNHQQQATRHTETPK